MNKENRLHRRVPLHGAASITDAMRVCEADIVNISYGGIAVDRFLNSMLKDLPKHFTAVISAGGFNAKVTMAPKWSRKIQHGAYSTVGFEIIGPFGTWHDFVRRAAGATHSAATPATINA